MVLCETVLCEMVLCEMVLCEMVLCEMINCQIYCKTTKFKAIAEIVNLQGEKKRKIRKQIKDFLNKSVPKSSRICKLVANYKTTLVSNRNGLVFVSHERIFTLRTPRLVNRKLCQNNGKESLRFVVVLNFDLREFWYFSELIEWSHVFVSLVPENCECTQTPICYVAKQ